MSSQSSTSSDTPVSDTATDSEYSPQTPANQTNQTTDTLARWVPPLPYGHPLTPILLLIIALALVPATMLTMDRVQFEKSQKTAAIVMDYPALVSQARRYGKEPKELLGEYQKLGVNGVTLYEDVIASLEQRGEIFNRTGAELLVQFPDDQRIKPHLVYTRSLVEGTIENISQRYNIGTRPLQIGEHQWLEWDTDPRFLPIGPNTELVDELKAKGMTVVYRPYDDESLKEVAADWPDVPFIAFTGEEVIGARTPERLEQVKQNMGERLPALIEGNPQRGLSSLLGTRGAVRLFALNPTWQNRLTPQVTASKYNLAARERGMRLLYVRPYPTVNETSDFLGRLSKLLKTSQVQVTQPVVEHFAPNTLLQWLCMLGPLAALFALGLNYPLPRLGMLVAVGTLLLCFGLNFSRPFSAMALVAAVSFPALGLVLRRQKTTDWFVATALSLVGVLFVSALGTSLESAMGLEPFRGVGLTLLFPLVLTALSFLPPQDIRQTAAQLYQIRIRLGDVAVVGVSLLLLAFVMLRRGNTTGGVVSGTESDLRHYLQDTLVRPRFKEIAGHPLGLLGLSGSMPSYLGPLLMLGGVMGQASILNTFSHFHTPFLISAQRCFLGLGLGLLFGLVMIYVIKFVIRIWQTHGHTHDLEKS